MPNGANKKLNFIPKVWDSKHENEDGSNGAYVPIYIAPDATNSVQGDVFLSDSVNGTQDAENGMTAATPKAVAQVASSANNKLDKTITSKTQTVAGKVDFSSGVSLNDGATIPNGKVLAGNVSGNATTSNTLKTSRKINIKIGEQDADGTSFNGGSDITIQIPSSKIQSTIGWYELGDVGSDKTNIVNTINTLVANGNDINDIFNYILPKNAGAHNSVFRGKNITGQLNSAYTAINAGTFDDVFVGDYFTKNVGGTNYTFRIAHLDKYYNTGDSALTRHHAVVVPDGNMGNAQMNTSNVTDGGYVGSAMFKSTLQPTSTSAGISGQLSTAFGSHLVPTRQLLDNTVDSAGNTTNAAWYSTYCSLMTEEEVYGARQQGVLSHAGWTYPGISYGQMALFHLAPQYICNRSNWWLRSVFSAANFCCVNGYGSARDGDASNSFGVRPRFLIG